MEAPSVDGDELVATEASDVPTLESHTQRVGQRDQCRVAAVVAKVGVDRFEVVDIDNDAVHDFVGLEAALDLADRCAP